MIWRACCSLTISNKHSREIKTFLIKPLLLICSLTLSQVAILLESVCIIVHMQLKYQSVIYLIPSILSGITIFRAEHVLVNAFQVNYVDLHFIVSELSPKNCVGEWADTKLVMFIFIFESNSIKTFTAFSFVKNWNVTLKHFFSFNLPYWSLSLHWNLFCPFNYGPHWILQ